MEKNPKISEIDLGHIIGEVWVPCSWLNTDYDYDTKKIIACIDSCKTEKHVECTRKMIEAFDKLHKVPLLTERLLSYLSMKHEVIHVE